MMPQPHIPNGGVDLRAPRQVVTKWDVWPVVVTEVAPGQVGRFGGEYSLTIVNVPAGSGHIIPYDRRGLESLRDDLNTVLEGNKDGEQVN